MRTIRKVTFFLAMLLMVIGTSGLVYSPADQSSLGVDLFYTLSFSVVLLGFFILIAFLLLMRKAPTPPVVTTDEAA